MKAKVYPLYEIGDEIDVVASSFCLHIQIICASLARGTTTIRNIVSNKEIDTTIKWCKSIGASIKKVNEKLVIKGNNNKIRLKNSLFICGETSTTAKLMIPLFCTFNQPAGVKANENVIKELETFKAIFDAYGITYYFEDDVVRFERQMESEEVEFDGDIDTYFMAGLMIALPLLNHSSIIKLRAPVRNENTYNTIVKILKKFHIDIKHPATMRYEINSNQRYISCKIKTEQDNLLLSYITLLTQRLKDNNNLTLLNYRKKSTQDTKKLLDYLKKYAVGYKRVFSKGYLKKKTLSLSKIEASVENSLPLLMVLGTFNSQEMIISKVDFNKQRVKKQYNIMTRVFTKLKLDYTTFDNEIMIHPSKVCNKVQVDCENDPYVVMALTMLGLLSDVPIVIRNVDCIFNIYKNFFDMLKQLGAVIEFIHN